MNSFLIGVASSIAGMLLWAGYAAFRTRMPLRTLRLAFSVVPRLSRSGVTGFFATRADYVRYRKQATATEYMAIAKEELVYVGLWLAQTSEIEDLHRTLRTMLDRDVRVTLVLLDDAIDNAMSTKLAAVLGLTAEALGDRLSNAWTSITEFKAKLPIEIAGRLTLLRHQEHLSASAFLIDRGRPSARTLVDIKLYGMGRQASFGIEFRPTKRGQAESLYERATRSFALVADRTENADLRRSEMETVAQNAQ